METGKERGTLNRAQGTILCYGASNTYGYDPRDFYSGCFPEEQCWTGILARETGWKVINEGVCGREIPHKDYDIVWTCRSLDQLLEEKEPRWFWVKLGTNDLLSNPRFQAEDVADRMETFLKRLQGEKAVSSGKVKLRLIVPPCMQQGTWVQEERLYRESRRLGTYYRDVARKLHIAFTDSSKWEIPVLYDGVHLSEEGHRLFAQHLLEEVFHQK